MFATIKRFGLLILVNVLIVVMISLILNLLGVGPYITAAGLNYYTLAIFCLVWGMGGAFISLFISKFMAKTMMGVQIIDNPNGQYGEIVRMVHQLAQKAKLPKMPEVGVYDSPEINAFATGPSRSNSLVAVSTGLLRSMNRDEVEGVLGHEIAHIANGDMVTMTLIQGVVNAFVMFLARVITFAIDQFLRDKDGEGSGQGLGFFARIGVTMALELVFGIFGTLVVAWFSRQREFRADSGSARYLGREKMIMALQALQRQFEGLETDRDSAAFQSMKISSKNGWFQLFSTHPQLEERIDALRRATRF